jgi:hypothetical protein
VHAAAPAAPSGDRADAAAIVLSLADAEKAFAAMAAAEGTKPAFLRHMARTALVFDDGRPVNGPAWWKDRPEGSGLLEWEPAFAEATASGDLGITTGPWDYRPRKEGAPPGNRDAASFADPVAWGEFLTVWGRARDGEWKFLLDIGISHDKPGAAAPPLKLRKPALDLLPRDKKEEVDEALASLSASDDIYLRSLLAWKKRTPADLTLADKARLLREGKQPVTGSAEVRAALQAAPAPVSCSRETLFVSERAELAFTTGVCTLPASPPPKAAKPKAAAKPAASAKPAAGAKPAASAKPAAGAKPGKSPVKPPPEQVTYVRIWRWWGWANSAAKRWELVVDLAIPRIPAPQSPPNRVD